MSIKALRSPVYSTHCPSRVLTRGQRDIPSLWLAQANKSKQPEPCSPAGIRERVSSQTCTMV